MLCTQKSKTIFSGESQSTISSSPSSNWSRSKERIEEEKVQGKPAMADTEKQNDEGYTKLEVVHFNYIQ